MKKLISAAAALAMAASMVGSAVPFATGAADASKAFELRPYLNKDGSQASLEISADQIAAGDVTIPIALYLVENEKDTEGFLCQWTVNSKDGDASNDYVSFKKYEPGTKYFDDKQAFSTTASGAIETDIVIGFAGTLTSNRAGVKFEAPGSAYYYVEPSYNATNCPNAWGSAVWTAPATGEGYNWIGAKSDDFPVTVFTATFAKGTPAGTYTIDFVDQLLDPDIPTNYTCMVENAGKYTAKAGNLSLKGVTITVGGSSSTNPPTTEPPVTTTTAKVDPPATTTTGKVDPPSVTPGERPTVGDFDEFTVTGTDIEVDAGGEAVEMEFYAKANGHKVVLVQCEPLFPDVPGLKCEIDDNTSYAFEHMPSYKPLDTERTQWSLEAMDPDTSDAAPVLEDEPIAIFKISADENTPSGTYYVGYKSYHVVEVSGAGVPPVPAVEFEAKVVYGAVKVNGITPPETTTTAPPVSSETTTTTVKTDPVDPPVSGDVTYGDVNCDGSVNVADAVLLNKWLHDAKLYDMSEQGKKNADCADVGDGINSQDSRAIMYHIVSHVEKLPTTASAMDALQTEFKLPM